MKKILLIGASPLGTSAVDGIIKTIFDDNVLQVVTYYISYMPSESIKIEGDKNIWSQGVWTRTCVLHKCVAILGLFIIFFAPET